MNPQDPAELLGRKPVKDRPAKKPSPSRKVEFTPPDGLDLSEFREGGESDLLCKMKLEGGKLCLVAVNGIPISQSTEEDEEKLGIEGSPDDPDAAQEGEEEGAKPGDRFMSRFRPSPKSIS